MEIEPTIWQEPRYFTAGDSLIFSRRVNGYLPSNGWGITYTLTDSLTGKQVAQFAGLADATQKFWLISQIPFAAGLPQGDYLLQGELLNAGTGERRQFYLSDLELGPDLQDGLAAQPQTTHAERMVPLLEARLEELASHNLAETELERSRLIIAQREDVLNLLKYYKELRASELRTQRQINTGQDQIAIHPVMAGNW
jgi:hypothetical protein